MRLSLATSLIALLAVPGALVAQDGVLSPIDSDLKGQLDFRDLTFAPCLDQESCTVRGIRIRAERQLNDVWLPAVIYWDPVDGLGVQGSNQNDEIDFDERLVVELPDARELQTIWLSDLFIKEAVRYNSELAPDTEDAEVAQISAFGTNDVETRLTVSGNFELPNDPFNEEVSEIYTEEGDMLRRVVFRESNVVVRVPAKDGDGSVGEIVAPIGQQDPEKLALFDGLQTVNVDMKDLLSRMDESLVFVQGYENIEALRTLVASQAELETLSASAAVLRVTSDVTNGEVAGLLQQPFGTNELIFRSNLQGSNDYSVAGLVFVGN